MSEEDLANLEHLHIVESPRKHILQLRDMYKEISTTPSFTDSQAVGIMPSAKSGIIGLLDRLLQLRWGVEKTRSMVHDRVSQLTLKDAELLIEAMKSGNKNRCDVKNLESLYQSLSSDLSQLDSYHTTIEKIETRVSTLRNDQEWHMSGNIFQVRQMYMANRLFAVVKAQKTSFNGHLVWGIDGIKRRLENAYDNVAQRCFRSHEFYTERYGYVMRAHIYFNGDFGVGKNSHISLHLIIKRGKYDALLEWPFNRKVTMKLKNQTGRAPDIVETIRPNVGADSFQRPKYLMNAGFGCSMLAPIRVAYSRAGGYVVDDTLFVEVIIGGSSQSVDGLRVSLPEYPSEASRASAIQAGTFRATTSEVSAIGASSTTASNSGEQASTSTTQND